MKNTSRKSFFYVKNGNKKRVSNITRKTVETKHKINIRRNVVNLNYVLKKNKITQKKPKSLITNTKKKKIAKKNYTIKLKAKKVEKIK